MALTSSLTFAGSMGPVCKAANVEVPCEHNAWDISGRALYPLPSVSTFSSNFSTIVDYSSSIDNNIEPPWGLGFQFEGIITLILNLNGYHYNGFGSSTLGLLAGSAKWLGN